jgi:endoglycosylceramidase
MFGLIAAILCGHLAWGAGALRADSRYFRDPQGRAVFLRGINVSGDVKVAPFTPLLAFDGSGAPDPAQLDPLPRWGFNAIRLLFIWEAYEPEPGRYNEAYLDQLTSVADQAWARGLYVIIDLHQDSYSHYVANGCGEGFPAWSVPARDRRPADLPVHDCGPMWVLGPATSPAMHRAFGALYADREGARTAYLALWSRLARHFAAHPGVIGYDLLNEPWGDERRELGPLYRDAARVIRAEDPRAILFIEPQVFLTAFGIVQSGLDMPEFGNFAYAPHFYDLAATILNTWSPKQSLIIRHGFGLMRRKARELGAPLFVGEFGVSGGTRNGRWFSDYQYDQLDQGFDSGAQWNYTPRWSQSRHDGWNSEDLSIVDDRGGLRPNFHPRPYARVVAGEPLAQRELRRGDASLDGYDLLWRQGAAGLETELYVPSEVAGHPERYEVTWEGAGLECALAPALNRLSCRSDAEGAPMRVRISSRRPASTAGN